MIDWSTLRHAYGEASGVPRLLDALASNDEADRNGGFCGFYGCLFPVSEALFDALAKLNLDEEPASALHPLAELGGTVLLESREGLQELSIHR